MSATAEFRRSKTEKGRTFIPVFFLFEQPGKEHQTTPQFFRRGVDKTEDIFSIFTMFSINVSSVYT